MTYRLGIDLGGTKIEIICVDEKGNELFRKRVPTPAGNYEKTLDAICDLVSSAENFVGASQLPVGIGTPGAISITSGLMKNSNSTCLNGKPIDRDLEQILGRKIRIANDANCFALSEATDGAAAGGKVVFGVILGTGTGGGVVVDGRILEGSNRIAGEWGHNPIPWPESEELSVATCYCGKQSCIESFLSGPGLARDFNLKTNQLLTAEQIAHRAQLNDFDSLQAMARYENRLAKSLAIVINILDPDVIVLGGGLSKISRLYDNVPSLLARYVFSDSYSVKFVPAKHGDSSGVRGAAWL